MVHQCYGLNDVKVGWLGLRALTVTTLVGTCVLCKVQGACGTGVSQRLFFFFSLRSHLGQDHATSLSLFIVTLLIVTIQKIQLHIHT